MGCVGVGVVLGFSLCVWLNEGFGFLFVCCLGVEMFFCFWLGLVIRCGIWRFLVFWIGWRGCV